MRAKKIIGLVLLLFFINNSCRTDSGSSGDSLAHIHYIGDYNLNGVKITVNDRPTDMKVFEKENKYYIKFTEEYKNIGVKDFGHLWVLNGKAEKINLFFPLVSLWDKSDYPKQIDVSVVRELNEADTIPKKPLFPLKKG